MLDTEQLSEPEPGLKIYLACLTISALTKIAVARTGKSPFDREIGGTHSDISTRT